VSVITTVVVDAAGWSSGPPASRRRWRAPGVGGSFGASALPAPSYPVPNMAAASASKDLTGPIAIPGRPVRCLFSPPSSLVARCSGVSVCRSASGLSCCPRLLLGLVDLLGLLLLGLLLLVGGGME